MTEAPFPRDDDIEAATQVASSLGLFGSRRTSDGNVYILPFLTASVVREPVSYANGSQLWPDGFPWVWVRRGFSVCRPASTAHEELRHHVSHALRLEFELNQKLLL